MLGVCLSLTSFLGGVFWNKRFFQLPIRLSAFLTSGWLIVLLSYGGIVGYLQETYYGLLIIGTLYFVYTLTRRPFKEWGKNLTKVEVAIWGLLFVFLIALSQLTLAHYDNFSHWALVTKYLTTFNQFPTPEQQIVTFTAYPLGASLFSYFWLGGTVFHEGLLIATHWGLMLLALMPLRQLVNDSIRLKMAYSLLFAGGAVLVTLKFVPMNSVLVDDLIAIYAVGVIASQVYLRDRLIPLSLFTAVMGGALSLMKNSALFFIVIIYGHFLALYIYRLRHSFRPKKERVVALVSSFFTFIPFSSWQLYVSRYFSNETSSKHAIDFDAYTQISAQKTIEDLKQIRSSFLTHILDFERPIILGIYITLALFLVLYLFFLWKRVGYWWLREVFLLSVLLTVFYGVSVYYMYIYSMPTHEAVRLASFDRYMETFYVFLMFYFIMIILLVMNTFKDHYFSSNLRWLSASFILVSLSVLSMKYYETYMSSHDESINKSQLVERLIDQAPTSIEKLAIISSDENKVGSDYFKYVGVFYTMNPEVEVIYDPAVNQAYTEQSNMKEYVVYLP